MGVPRFVDCLSAREFHPSEQRFLYLRRFCDSLTCYLRGKLGWIYWLATFCRFIYKPANA